MGRRSTTNTSKSTEVPAEQRLRELSTELPIPPQPFGAYKEVVQQRGKPYACNSALMYTSVVVFGPVRILHGPECREKKQWFLDQLLAKYGQPDWTFEPGYPLIDRIIRNRPGMGTALRCMLEMHVFAEYLLKDNRTEDWHFLEKLYHGRALTSGGWYDIEREWEKEESGPMPEDAKDLIRALINLPRVGKIVRTVHDTDEGAAYLYSLYSEFVHPAFSRPRDDSEAAMGIDGIFAFGTSQFYGALLDSQEPAELLGRDIKTGSVVLQFFWPRLLQIDPLFDEKHRDSVQNKLKEHGVVPINQPGQNE